MNEVLVYKPFLPRFAVAVVVLLPLAAILLGVSVVLPPIAVAVVAVVTLGVPTFGSWRLGVMVRRDEVTVQNLLSRVRIPAHNVDEVWAAKAWWGSDDDQFLHFRLRDKRVVGATVTLWPGKSSRALVEALRNAGMHVAVDAPSAPSAWSRKRSVWRTDGSNSRET